MSTGFELEDSTYTRYIKLLIMNIRVLFKICFVFITLATMTSCKMEKIVYYVHEPSQKFYKNFEYDDIDMEDYVANGVLFVTSVKQINHSEYIVWLGVYSKIDSNKIVISKATIQGDNWEEKRNYNKELLINKQTQGHGLFENELRLFQVKGDQLNKIFTTNANCDLLLKVFYETQSDSTQPIKVIEFKIRRTVNKYTVFPT